MYIDKKYARANLLARREAYSPEGKEDGEREIQERVILMPEYKNARMVLSYVSTQDEISTALIIKDALCSGKIVAVPFCRGKGEMEFYIITSAEKLRAGKYGILEPDISVCERVNPADFAGSVCIVPALAFDQNGYRIGYGGGYYDRFLQNYTGTSIGLCLQENLFDSLPKDSFDQKVCIVVTQKKQESAPNGGPLLPM